jgi:MerR HTH family regulatory protein
MTDFYPGSEMRVGERPTGAPAADWGTPVVFNVRGIPTEFFTIGQVAAALGRSPVTLRAWERQNYFPGASFRSPAIDKKKARRLYTRAQLEAAVRIAHEEGLMDFTTGKDGQTWPKRNVTETKFVERLREAFRRLAQT